MGTGRLWSSSVFWYQYSSGCWVFLNFFTSCDSNLYKFLAGGLCFPLIFPNYSHSSLCPTSDTGPLPEHIPFTSLLPSPHSPELFTPSGHPHSSPFKPGIAGRSMKAHCVWRTAHHKNILLCHVPYPFGPASGNGWRALLAKVQSALLW